MKNVYQIAVLVQLKVQNSKTDMNVKEKQQILTFKKLEPAHFYLNDWNNSPHFGQINLNFEVKLKSKNRREVLKEMTKSPIHN